MGQISVSVKSDETRRLHGAIWIYETLVDPRLNHQQSLEMAFLVVDELSSVKG